MVNVSGIQVMRAGDEYVLATGAMHVLNGGFDSLISSDGPAFVRIGGHQQRTRKQLTADRLDQIWTRKRAA